MLIRERPQQLAALVAEWQTQNAGLRRADARAAQASRLAATQQAKPAGGAVTLRTLDRAVQALEAAAGAPCA